MSIDHLVINVLWDIGDAARLFARLGFCLTPRGHHSLGSINHLMVTRGAYLELVGVPRTGLQRQDVLDSPRGLSGLVFRSDDATATHAGLAAAGFDVSEPILLERPVDLEAGPQMARFHNVRLAPGAFPEGRVYFCHHLTPHLVWRREWLCHPNGFTGLSGLTIQSPDPERTARDYATLVGTGAAREDGIRVIRDGDFAIRITAGAHHAFLDATLDFKTIDAIASRARDIPGVTWRARGPDAGLLQIPAYPVDLICRAV